MKWLVDKSGLSLIPNGEPFRDTDDSQDSRWGHSMEGTIIIRLYHFQWLENIGTLICSYASDMFLDQSFHLRPLTFD